MALYDEIPDISIVFKVNERFYEKVYDDPWMYQYFQHTDQEFITQQQTDFILQAMGGPKNYSGRLVKNAHPHMFITDELFEAREQMLKDALAELNAPANLVEFWLKLDYSFKKVLVRNSVDECEKRFFTDEILAFPKPNSKKVA